ncbi:alpha-D-ribose 1-methylphosphonate 5-triphosphate synthase subunit PhnG [Rhodococcus sp. SMB37]|uniref:phosphonate C-P lyase system protein PhnG n=1 Tax=Rhodococcus sp. SMB37 TaxID=2512213 RepID=UPI0010484BB0|nr:phosphonate C-P lyase system protein PhnG [Rhodococcus sp. SMB37]TCN50734.1 alpha-D-ribose 1-methylphosphonate 5-triphosphate synthase subunit PhnG [Rhodococcus sp. SMB37]
MTSHTYSRERLAELLAVAPEEDLVSTADACLSDGAALTVLTTPEIGCIATQVREPIGHVRFFLGNVLACHAEVRLDGTRGWAMRMGDDRAAVLAAAVCDAEVAAGRPNAGHVLDLCARIEAELGRADAEEWAHIAPTIVQFEELT